MPRPFSTGCEGYTFIELLIAIAILGLVVTPVFTLFSLSSLSIHNSGNHTLAANLCRNQLESIKAAGYKFALENCAGSGGAYLVEENLADYPAFSRTTFIQAYSGIHHLENGDDPPAPLLLQVEVTVSWTVKGTQYSETVTTLLSTW
jgi:prepilin-type N-terminal cleavage/methylation domain-containing protein